MLKLKIGNKAAHAQATGGQNGQQRQQQPPTPAPPSTSTPTPGGGFKLKLSVSQPPTPIEQPGPSLAAPAAAAAALTEKKKRSYQKKQNDGSTKGKKRAAEDEDGGPALKRIASGPVRKISLKLPQQGPAGEEPGKLNKISLIKRKQSMPKIVNISAKGRVPPRQKGVGYDSEDSETERDPAIQQAFVLRMEDNEDAAYLRNAIAEGKIGPHPSQGDAEVSLKFVEKNYRRAVVKVRGRMYGAVLVDLPCIIESMKSHDRKGWWKVADIAQMLLVLGRCETEEQAKTMPLPREINKDSYQYAHGLTPPMHWVRKRRFRKRLNYNEAMNVEEEVKRLLEADRECEQNGGQVSSTRGGTEQHTEQAERQGSEYNFEFGDDDAEGEDAVETVEKDQQDEDMEEEEEDEDDEDLIEAQMQAMFEEDDQQGSAVQELAPESPGPIADSAASMAAIESAMNQQAADDTDATPVGTPAADATEQSEEESDEDEDDEDSPDVVDDDAAAKAMERAQQLEEIADLEREIEKVRQKVGMTTNQLLAQREKKKLTGLEEELAVKKQVFGLDDEE